MSGAPAGLETLVEGLFHYAGMFPPANRPMDDALRASASLPRTLRRPGLVGAEFVCAAARLADLESRLPAGGWAPGRRFRCCVLGPALGGGDAAPPGGHREAIARAAALEDRLPGFRSLTYETRCPAARLDEGAAAALEEIRAALGGWIGRVYLEPECAGPEWPSAVGWIVDFWDSLPAGARPGLKVRCGGPSGADPESVARLVAAAADRALPLKFSAGLHHAFAVPGSAEARIGFLALALAVRLRRAHGAGFSLAAIEACITATDRLQFDFRKGASWLEFGLDAPALGSAAGAVIGSCSLHEPDAELEALFPVGAVRSLDKTRDPL